MSNPSIDQMCEFYRQIAAGIITAEAVQETIERACELALSQLRKQIQDHADLEARTIPDPLKRATALINLAFASQNAETLKEIKEIISGLDNPDVDFAAMTQIVESVTLNEWCASQALRIPDPHHRALRLAALAAKYTGVEFEASHLLNDAREAIKSMDDEDHQNEVRVAIIAAEAERGDSDRARDLAREIYKPYWSAMAFVKIFQFSRGGGISDYINAVKNAEELDNHPRDDIYKKSAIILCEINQMPDAFQLVGQMIPGDNKFQALLSIVKAAVRFKDNASLSKALDLLEPKERRWWKTEALICIARGVGIDKKKKAADVRAAIGDLQDEGHRAVAFAKLAAISRDPGDLKQSIAELHSIRSLEERIKTATEMIGALQ